MMRSMISSSEIGRRIVYTPRCEGFRQGPARSGVIRSFTELLIRVQLDGYVVTTAVLPEDLMWEAQTVR